jgi:hypothetical protein
MSNETADHKKKLEELAREAGAYLSPERLRAIEERLKGEERRRAEQAAEEDTSSRRDRQPADRAAPRPVGRPRGSRSVNVVDEKRFADRAETRREKPQKELYMTGSRLRRFF